MGVIDWGDVPTWLATIGAGVAVWFASRAYAAEVARDRRAENLLAQGQAARVAAWADEAFDYGGQNEFGRETIPRVFLRNASELPAYDVLLFSYVFDWRAPQDKTPSGKWTVGLLPPTTDPVKRLPLEDADGTSHQYVMQFRDAAGRTWHRDLSGVLREGHYERDRDKFAERLWEENC